MLSSLPDWTADPTDDVKLVRRDTNGTATFGQIKFSTVWNYIKNKGRFGAAYATKETGAVAYWKIKINSTANWMLCFVITLYQNYRATKIMVSGYNYHSSATNQWHDPRAIIIVAA